MTTQTQMQHPYELFAYQVGQDMKVLEGRVVALENKPAPEIHFPDIGSSNIDPLDTEEPKTKPTETFIFRVKAGLSAEDRAKVEARTHEAEDIQTSPVDVVLALGRDYAEKRYMAFSSFGEAFTNGTVNYDGKIFMGKLHDMNEHQVLVHVFNDPIKADAQAYLHVSSRVELLSKIEGLKVDIRNEFIGGNVTSIKLEGITHTGNRSSRDLVFGKDELKIVVAGEYSYNKGKVVFDSTLPEYAERATGLMSGRDSLYLGEELYRFIVKAQEGGTFEVVKQVGLPSQL